MSCDVLLSFIFQLRNRLLTFLQNVLIPRLSNAFAIVYCRMFSVSLRQELKPFPRAVSPPPSPPPSPPMSDTLSEIGSDDDEMPDLVSASDSSDADEMPDLGLEVCRLPYCTNYTYRDGFTHNHFCCYGHYTRYIAFYVRPAIVLLQCRFRFRRYQRWRALLDSYISNPHDGPDIGVIVHEYSHAYRSYTQL